MRPSQLPHDFNTSEVIWRDQAQVSDAMAAFLDTMVAYHFIQRYQTATEALQVLRQVISGSPTVMTPPNRTVGRMGATVIPGHQTQPQSLLSGEQPKRIRKIGRIAVIALPALVGTLVIVILARNLSRSNSIPLLSNPLDSHLDQSGQGGALPEGVSEELRSAPVRVKGC